MKRFERIFASTWIVPFILLLITLFLSGCSSRFSEYTADTDHAQYDSVSSERASDGTSFSGEASQPVPSQDQSGSGADLGDIFESQHKIIYTGDVVMESLTFDETVGSIQSYVNGLGGYAESSYIEGRRITETTRPPRRTASFTFRIPQQRFHGFTEGLKEYGNVLSSSTHGENITERYFDTEARLTSLRIQEERVLSLLERADDIENVLRIESELTNLRYQIESLTGSLQKWDNLVQFSTIRVEIREVDQITTDPDATSWSEEISEAFKDSILAVIRTLQNLVILLITILPFVIVFIPLIMAGVKVYVSLSRKFKERKSSKKDHSA